MRWIENWNKLKLKFGGFSLGIGSYGVRSLGKSILEQGCSAEDVDDNLGM